jgi:hypothetical protein
VTAPLNWDFAVPQSYAKHYRTGGQSAKPLQLRQLFLRENNNYTEKEKDAATLALTAEMSLQRM